MHAGDAKKPARHVRRVQLRRHRNFGVVQRRRHIHFRREFATGQLQAHVPGPQERRHHQGRQLFRPQIGIHRQRVRLRLRVFLGEGD